MTERKLFEAINLDKLSVDASDYKDAARAFGLYAIYAESKHWAMELRLAGDMEAALSHEKAAEVAYKRLPQWAKW